MKARSGVRAGLALLFAAGLSACAAGGPFNSAAAPVPYPPPGYMHMVATSALDLYWNCTQSESGVLRVAGDAFNVWGGAPVQHLELDLVGVDRYDRTVSEAFTEARDTQIMVHQSSPFELHLRATGREVHYDLYYQFQYPEGNHNDLLLSSAMTDIAFPRSHGTPFLVHDACSPTQHLAR